LTLSALFMALELLFQLTSLPCSFRIPSLSLHLIFSALLQRPENCFHTRRV
jgi:Zn-dependent membrane protease YugP